MIPSGVIPKKRRVRPIGVAYESSLTTIDTPEQIQICLECDKPECTNCIHTMEKNRRRERRDVV